jgi:hypothetical protein
MRKLETTQQEELSQITEAQFVTQAAQHDLKHNVGGKLQMVKRSAGPFVELTAAGVAAK